MLSKINDSIKQGMLQGNTEYVNVLRLVKAELLNNEKTEKPKDQLDVIKSYVKKLHKALDAFASRPDELVKLNKEITILNEFLPAPVSAVKILDHVSVTVQNLLVGNKGTPNAGQIIKSVKLQLPDADGTLVAQITNQYLKDLII